MNEKRLPVARQFLFDDPLHQGLAEGSNRGLDGQAILRRGFDYAHVTQAHEGHVQRARNRRGRHREHGDVLANLFQAFFVGYAEALLFIDDQQAEILKFNVFGEEPVGADHDIHLAGFELFERLLLLLFGAETGSAFQCVRETPKSAGGRFGDAEKRARSSAPARPLAWNRQWP